MKNSCFLGMQTTLTITWEAKKDRLIVPEALCI